MAESKSQRLDKWLWYARFVKTRTLASRLIEGGKIRVNSARALKAATTVKPGDIVTAMIARHLYVVKIIGCGARRGPADEAQALYELLETTRPEPGSQKAKVAKIEGSVPMREPGAGRPTKRDRRLTDRLRS